MIGIVLHQFMHAPGFDGGDHHLMLALQQAGDHLFIGSLAQLFSVRRQLFGDDGAADIDKRFEHGIVMPTIFGLDVIDLSLMLNICIETSDHLSAK